MLEPSCRAFCDQCAFYRYGALGQAYLRALCASMSGLSREHYSLSVFASLAALTNSTWGVKYGVGTRVLLGRRCMSGFGVSRRFPVRPSWCTVTSTAPGAEARPHDGLACQVSAATVLGKGSHGRRFHSTIDAPRPLVSEYVTNRGTGPQDRIRGNFAMRK